MPSVPLLLSQAFNGLALGSLLALVSSGLTIILGTLGVLNFAHGALFMLGAYAIFMTMQATGSFVLAVLVGCVCMLAVGARDDAEDMPAAGARFPRILAPRSDSGRG